MNVTRFVRGHDRLVRDATDITPEFLARHREVRDFVHQERVVHLHVTLAFGLFTLFALGLAMLRPNVPAALLVVLVGGLEIAYIRHYFLLENRVQDWTGLLLRWEGRHPEDPRVRREESQETR